MIVNLFYRSVVVQYDQSEDDAYNLVFLQTDVTDLVLVKVDAADLVVVSDVNDLAVLFDAVYHLLVL